MAVGGILILCVSLAWGLHWTPRPDNGVQMIVKHQKSDDYLTINFSIRYFKAFYDCLCTRECMARLRDYPKYELYVYDVDVQPYRAEPPSDQLTCFHNATSATVTCKFGEADDDDDDSQGNFECFTLDNGADCGCMGIRWKHLGETIFANRGEIRVRRCNSCKVVAPKVKTLPTQTSTTVTSSSRNTAKGNNTTKDNNFLFIINIVGDNIIIILVVIIAVVLYCCHRRGRNMKTGVTTSYKHDRANNRVMPDSDSYFAPDRAISTNKNSMDEKTQVKYENTNKIEPFTFRKLRTTVHHDVGRDCVEIHDIAQNIQKEDGNYDVIVDKEIDDNQYVKMAAPVAMRCSCRAAVGDDEDDKPQGRSDKPQGRSDEPQGRSDEPQCGSDKPQCGSDKPQCGSDKPQCGSDEPQCGSDEPQCGSDKPQCGSDKPQCGSDEPQCGSDKPQCGSDKPQCGSDEPQCGSDKPQCGSDEPQGRSDEPQGRSDEPQGRSDEPQGRSDEDDVSKGHD